MRNCELSKILKDCGMTSVADGLGMVERFSGWEVRYRQLDQTPPTVATLWVVDNCQSSYNSMEIVEIPQSVYAEMQKHSLHFSHTSNPRFFENFYLGSSNPFARVAETLSEWLWASYRILGETETSMRMKLELRGRRP